MSEERTNKEIELRSEKVRNIVGKVPPRLLRIGISVISLVLVCVLILAYIIPYPQYKTFDIQIYSNPDIQTASVTSVCGIFRVSIDEAEHVKIGQEITIALSKQTISGRITEIDSIPQTDPNTQLSFYSVQATFLVESFSTQAKRVLLYTNSKASVLISDKPILKRVLNSSAD